LFQQLALPIAEIIQYNKDNRYYSNMAKSALSITLLCDLMLDKSLGNAVSILLFINVFINYLFIIINASQAQVNYT